MIFTLARQLTVNTEQSETDRTDTATDTATETDTDTGEDGVGDAETVDTKHAATGTGLGNPNMSYSHIINEEHLHM